MFVGSVSKITNKVKPSDAFQTGSVVRRREEGNVEQTSNKEHTERTFRDFLFLVYPIVAVVAAFGSTLYWAIHTYLTGGNAGLTALVFLTPILISAGWMANFMSTTKKVKNQHQTMLYYG